MQLCTKKSGKRLDADDEEDGMCENKITVLKNLIFKKARDKN